MFDSLVNGAKSMGHAASSMLGGFNPSQAGELIPGAPMGSHTDPTHTGNPMGGNLPFPSLGPIAELLSGLPSLPHLDPSAAGEMMSSGIGKSIGGMAGGISKAVGGISEMLGGLPSMPHIDAGKAAELMGALPF